MELRYYQADCNAAIYDYFSKHSGNPIVALPTGTGKSYVIASFLHDVFKKWPFQRAMMITHVEELIDQNYKELIDLWPTAPAGIYSAGLGRKEVRPITFGGIKSVIGKGFLFGHVDLIMVDECHLVSPEDDTLYETFLNELKEINPKIKVIGLTATPYRLKQGLLTEPTFKNGVPKPALFTDICYDITGREPFNRLIAEGYIAPLIPKKPNTEFDVSGVKMVGGEFAKKELQEAVDRDEITYAAVREMVELGAERKHWLVFGTGVRHCEHIVSMLESFGIPAACVHSKMPKEQRREAIAGFKSGKYRALVNNNVLTTGFNFKAIDLIGVMRPTASPSLWVQMLGRGTRPEDGKIDCLVLDFAGNTRRLGPINDPKIPNRAKGSKKSVSVPPAKLCLICETWNHPSARICIKCGDEFPPPEVNIAETAGTEELIATGPADVPIYIVHKVTGINYDRYRPHHSSNKPPSLRVTYHCGLRKFSHFLCLEHIGYPSKLARDHWRTAADDDKTEPPATIDEALTRLGELQEATHLRIWERAKDPQIMAYDYSGTAFGTEKPQF